MAKFTTHVRLSAYCSGCGNHLFISGQLAPMEGNLNQSVAVFIADMQRKAERAECPKCERTDRISDEWAICRCTP